MNVYHGSYLEIVKPDVVHSRKNVDFGQGFYTTSLYEQAEKWCRKFKKRKNIGIVNRYILDEAVLHNIVCLGLNPILKNGLIL